MKRIGIYRLYALFVVAFTLILLLMPPNQQTLDTYNLNTVAYRVLLFCIVALPAFLTWLAAFYGYNQLRIYSDLVSDTREGEAFSTLRNGVKWLALYLPIISLVTISFSAIANAHTEFRAFADVASNYVAIIIALIAFAVIGNGGRQLADLSKVRPSLLKVRLLTLSFIVMGVLYCYFIIQHGLNPDTSPYHLPLSWILVTNVVPYFFAWMLGLIAVLDIDAYADNVTGILYRQALKLLSGGLLTVIVTSILIQYVNSANLQRERFVIGFVLIMRYALYACLAAGFGMIASSAKKLQQIEKI